MFAQACFRTSGAMGLQRAKPSEMVRETISEDS